MLRIAAAQSWLGQLGERARRWWLVACGLVLVAIGVVGIIVPGLPTTIFLIGASWCFARSCPWLEKRLLRHPIFRPFLQPLQPGAEFPRRTRIIATTMMWTAIVISSVLIGRVWVGCLLISAGAIGTWCIWRFRRAIEPRAERDVRAAHADDGAAEPL